MVALPPELRDAPELPLILVEVESWLENERLLRAEFRDWLTPEIKAEFINGEKIVHSPARLAHTEAQMNLSSILRIFATRHALGLVLGEKALIALSRNDYEPDVVFFGTAKAEKFHPEQMIFPAPDLVVEILSQSTASRDLGVKYRDYAAHGISEYWIIDAEARSVQRHVNESGSFSLQSQSSAFIVTPLFPGLQLPINAIFESRACIELIQSILKD